MNKKLIIFSIFFVLFALTSCKEKTYTHTVIFFLDETTVYRIEEVKHNNYLKEIAIPRKEGYQFIGWECLGEPFSFNQKITSDMKVVAIWRKNKYKVKYQTNAEQVIQDSLVDCNQVITRPVLQQRIGYQFLGWYLEDEPYDFNIPVTNDITLVAKWEKVEYRVIFVTNCDTSIERKYIPYNDYLEEPELLQKEGYTFLGWFENGELFDFTTPITFPHRLEAMWDIQKEKLAEVLDNMIDIAIEEEGYLPNTVDGLNGTIQWSTSNNNIVDEDGKITRLTNENLILTATITKEKESYQLEFNKEIEKRYLKPLVNGKVVSGYFAGYSGFHPLSEKALEQLDIINFAFGQIKDGKAYLPNESVALETLKYRENGIHVVLAIGGWGAGGFSEAMLTSESRTKLVDSIMEILKKYQFDGIDIDWEYPTSSVAGIGSNPNDKNNLTLFCQELKERMQAYRDDLILSIAVTVSDAFYDFRKLNQCIDYFNVMTYDYAMGKQAHHDSPLYSSSYGASSMHRAVTFMKERVDTNKIIPGAAFYCRNGQFQNAEGLGNSLSTSMGSGSLSFKNLKELMIQNPDFIECYDEVACAAYAIYNGMFYSFDNEKSIIDKCNYVKENQLGGLMCWELTQDYVDENGVSVLVNAMYVTLKK